MCKNQSKLSIYAFASLIIRLKFDFSFSSSLIRTCNTSFILQSGASIISLISLSFYDEPVEKRNGEFDIVTLDDKGYIFYEAKFIKEPVTESIVQDEIRQVKQTDLDCYRYGIFARAGFTCDQEKERILIDLSELYK